jgi:hypothetical protein
MATPTKPLRPVTIELDRTRRLAFDFNAMCFLEEEAGINVLEGMDFAQFRSPSKLRMLLAAMLQSDALEHREELTAAKVGALLTLDRMAEFSALIERTVSASMPDADPKPEPEGADAHPPTRAG